MGGLIGGLIGGIGSLIGGLIGPSAAQKADMAQEQQLGQETSQFFNQWTQNANTVFGENQALAQQVTGSLSPILAAGIGQQGFTPEELAAMNTSAVNNAGGNYKNAAQALGNRLAGAGGGAIPTAQSGAASQLQAQLASNEAGNLSNTENQITQANYATGRQNYLSALSGLEGEQNILNPNAYANVANAAGQQAFKEDSVLTGQQAQMDASRMAALTGGLAGLGGGALGVMNNINFFRNLDGGKLFGSGGYLEGL